MKLSEMRQRLTAENIRLSKSLGQNFLHDTHQLQRIVEMADVGKSDHVLEIGPGLGPLTELLAARAGKVLAVEKDRRLAGLLSERLRGCTNLEIIALDALDFLQQKEIDWSSWKVVSNLPYSVASLILVELSLLARGPVSITTTVQQEVAHRLRAGPGTDSYGVLTLLVQQSYRPSAWFKIPPACFFPPPKVDSVCLLLHRRPTPEVPLELLNLFQRVVKRAFSQRRKKLMKLLKHEWPAKSVEEAFRSLGLAFASRAEEVSLSQFAGLAQMLGCLSGCSKGENNLH